MNKLIILNLLFLTGCATNTGYKRRDIYQVRHTVERLYQCPSGYALSVNNLECVKIADFTAKKENTVKHINRVKKPLIRAKRHVKIDCKRVFQEINKCSM